MTTTTTTKTAEAPANGACGALVFYVNQVKVTEANPDPEETLIGYLRRKLHLTGTKLACGEGGCGACTVMVSRYISSEQRIENLAVNACLAPLCSMHGAAVTTIEGVEGSGALTQLQRRLAECHGSQCGFCTPGMLMTAYALLRSAAAAAGAAAADDGDGKGAMPTRAQMEEAVQGNLCRCTGYRSILEAFGSFTSDSCSLGSSCCRSQSQPAAVADSGDSSSAGAASLPYESSQEPIFPSELQLNSLAFDSASLRFSSASVTWHRPTSLRELLLLKAEHPEAKIINGNSEIGVELKSKKVSYPHLVHAAFVKELQELNFAESGVTIGAGVTLTRLLTSFRRKLDEGGVGEGGRRTLEAFVNILHWFSGTQIRNVAAIGGNVMTASPISDLNPLLMACGAVLKLQSVEGSRSLPLNPSFFPAYRRTSASPRELLVSIFVPFCSQLEHLVSLKQSRRRDDDIAIVNLTMRVRFNDESAAVGVWKVDDVAVCCGGMAATTVRAAVTEAAILGGSWGDERLLASAQRAVGEDFQLQPNAPGGQVAYRMTLAASLLSRCFHRIGRLLLLASASSASASSVASSVAYSEPTTAERLPLRPSEASQVFRVSDSDWPVGQPIGHVGAQAQTQGATEYVDDIPAASCELFAHPVLSNCASGRLEGLDFSSAADVPGVVGFVTSRDVPGSNRYGPEVQDDRIFVECDDGEIFFCGDVVAAVVADSRDSARRAAQRVRPLVRKSATKPPLVTVSDAVAAGSFFDGLERRLVDGDPGKAIDERATHVVEGEFSVGGQEHFYFETHACLAVPKDGCRELQLHSSTQNPTLMQRIAASALNLQLSRVSVKVKRIGGGFGGKEYRSAGVVGIASVAAKKFNRPVRVVLDREDDMVMSGTRHPVLASFRAGADSSGRLVGLIVDAFLNGGFSSDISSAVGECFALKLFSGYRVPASDIRVRICRTNTPSCTAFRGFGAPQAVALMETVMSRLAEASGIDNRAVREANLLESGELSPYGQDYGEATVRRCWHECLDASEFERRQREVRDFNAASAGSRKRGLSITPVHYGVGFGHAFLHQAGAIVNVYLDGSVLVTHAGVEMGQGLHTKLLQVAARILRVPMETIFVSETATDRVPNTTSSAASMTTDVNAPAVMDACQQLIGRLEPFRLANPDGRWLDWVKAAYFSGVGLSACGFFHGPEPHLDSASMRGSPFIYYTSGAACSEVEIDCVTGEHVVRRVDIVMDLGESLNPAIDIGQIEGAFMQGYGMFTLEEQRYSPLGQLYTRGPGAYKIPGFGDIPERLRIRLLRDSRCRYKRAVYSSKAVGEPPLCLAASVLMATRAAVLAAREAAGEKRQLRLDSPATCERIRMACGDRLANEFAEAYAVPKDATPWELKLAQ